MMVLRDTYAWVFHESSMELPCMEKYNAGRRPFGPHVVRLSVQFPLTAHVAGGLMSLIEFPKAGS